MLGQDHRQGYRLVLVQQGIGHVRDLGTGRLGPIDHRLQHLGRRDHDLAAVVGGLNDLLLGILPACKLSEATFENFMRTTAKVNDDPTVGHLQFRPDGTNVADLGQQLSRFRASLFFHTKRGLLRTVLDRTATKPKKAEDEYDYPEELPQIMLNRPRAAASVQRRNHIDRLCHSMFGQMLDAIHFLPPRIQRLAYTHPMDDAQQRSFKMKFEGEGVDDYGGTLLLCATYYYFFVIGFVISPKFTRVAAFDVLQDPSERFSRS